MLIHHYRDIDPAKVKMYFEKADELDNTTNNTKLQDRVVLQVGIDKFLELANEAYENGRLNNGFGSMFFYNEHREHPEFKTLVEKVQKGK